MKNHSLWMVLGCALPLLLIFILPVLGVSSNVSLFIFIILIFACHLFMIGGHQAKHDEPAKEKEGKHGCH